MPPAAEIVSRHHGEAFLEARRIHRELSDDLVIFWSTSMGPFELINACDWATHAPKHAQSIEVIADSEVIEVESIEQLRDDLTDRQIVRFNTNDWSVTWLAPHGGDSAEVQATLGKLPAIMSDMVKSSVAGIPANAVDSFFAELGTLAS